MDVWAGGHNELPPEAVELAVAFFRRTLAS
jgi:hypothetical protein